MNEELEVINFINISGEEFIGMWGGQEYRVGAGEIKQYPKFLAEHLAKHLVDKILIQSGKDYGSDALRKPLLDRILTMEVLVHDPMPAKDEDKGAGYEKEKLQEKGPEEAKEFEEAPDEKEEKPKRGRPKKS